MSDITITLSREEAEAVSTVLNTLNGRLHYKAIKKLDGSLDRYCHFWNNITKKLATSMNMDWMVATEYTKALENADSL